MKRVFIRKKKKAVKECDGTPGALSYGMGNPGPGSGDRFDMGFIIPKKKSKKKK